MLQFSKGFISFRPKVCVVYPLFLIAFFVIAVIFLSMDICMNKGVGMTKRLDNVTKVLVITLRF